MAGHFDFVRFAGKTDVGRKRKNNEDNFGMFPEVGVWLVADGMGGGEDGEVASAAVVRAVSGFAEAHPFPSNAAVAADPLVSGLSDAIDAASQWIYSRTRERGLKSCASTVVGVAIDRTHPGKAVAFHAGDSRLYLIRKAGLFGSGIRQITRDHSAAEAMGVKEKEKLNPMWVNVITRAVGLHERTDVERTPFDVKKGDRILICSDGLSGMVDDKGLLAIIKGETDVAKTVDKLIAAANEAGGKDNVTAILLEIEELPKRDVEAKVLKDLAVGEEKVTPSDGATRPTCPTLSFESLSPVTSASETGDEVSSGVSVMPNTGLDENGEPRSACLDRNEIKRLSGRPGAPAVEVTPEEIRLMHRVERLRLLLWRVVVLVLGFLVVVGLLVAARMRSAEDRDEVVERPNLPKERPVDVVQSPQDREPVRSAPVAPALPVPVASALPGPDVQMPKVPAVSVPEEVPSLPEPGVQAESIKPIVSAQPDAMPEVDETLADMAEAFERKSLSQFEAVVKNALRQSGEEGVRQIGEFSSEMRKVSARASKYVNEMRYVKGSSRLAEDLVVDFKYALDKAVLLRQRLDAGLLSKWDVVAEGDAKDVETRSAAAALVIGLTEALR